MSDSRDQEARASLEAQTSVPAWYRVAVTVRNRIQRGQYAAGAAIPSEAELAAEFGLSRVTIRRSLDELVRAGLLRRRQGRGTFVRADASPAPLHYSGYLEDLISLFTGTEQAWAERSVVPAPPDIASPLRIAPATPVVLLERLRLADGERYNLTRNFLPREIGERIALDDLGELRMLEILDRRMGRPAREAIQTIAAIVADREIAERLGIEPGAAILHMRIVYSGAGGAPLAVTDLFFRGDRYRHVTRLTGGVR